MPQKIIEKNSSTKLYITVSVRFKNHPNGRIQLQRVFDDVEKGSSKANALERELQREVEREKAHREIAGLSWETLLSLYDIYATEKLNKGEWMQSRQTYDEAISALNKWTGHWKKEAAAKITASDVTKVFHKVKESGCSDVLVGKLRGDIKKVFEFGILFDHVKGIKHSPTIGVSVKSRKRMRTEILRNDEIKKLLTYAKQYEPTWYYIWSFAVYTGCRNGELYSLKWSDINFKDRMITVQRSYNKKYKIEKCTKTEDWRHISICEPLWLLIEELRLKHDHDVQRGVCNHVGYVLPRPGVWQNGSQAEKLRNFCAEIGITSVCFHTLRACFATELLKRKVDVPSVMRVGGWKSLKTMMHYVRLSGIYDKGITDPLDYRSDDPLSTNKALMNAVGNSFEDENNRDAKVIPLITRRLPSFA